MDMVQRPVTSHGGDPWHVQPGCAAHVCSLTFGRDIWRDCLRSRSRVRTPDVIQFERWKLTLQRLNESLQAILGVRNEDKASTPGDHDNIPFFPLSPPV
ncbi:hypothetical protein BaRGS_00017664 [Batillaria attramentaria]|uniref:Uncharacterized protein n=1 Tax=Batillaria attramentaria TaxID=370345 RepID=A0ABD0KVA3_9CAEN